MSDFFKAALPWVLIGIAIAIFAANHSRQKKSQAAENQHADAAEGKPYTENRMTEGMCIGMCMGVMFGTTEVCDLGTGISLGMLLGMVVGMTMKK